MEIAIIVALVALASIAFLYTRTSRIATERDELEQQRAELKKRLDAESREVQKLGDRLAGVQRDLAEARDAVVREKKKAERPDKSAVAQKLERAEQELEAVTHRLEAATEKLNDALAERASLAKSAQDESTRAAEAAREITRLRDELSKERASRARAIEEAKANVPLSGGVTEAQIREPLERRISELSSQLAAASERAEKLAAERKSLDNKMKTVLRLNEAYRRDSMMAKLQAEAFEDANLELHAQLLEETRRERKSARRRAEIEARRAEVSAVTGRDGEDRADRDEGSDADDEATEAAQLADGVAGELNDDEDAGAASTPVGESSADDTGAIAALAASEPTGEAGEEARA